MVDLLASPCDLKTMAPRDRRGVPKQTADLHKTLKVTLSRQEIAEVSGARSKAETHTPGLRR